jgi:hypothetical protein
MLELPEANTAIKNSTEHIFVLTPRILVSPMSQRIHKPIQAELGRKVGPSRPGRYEAGLRPQFEPNGGPP